MAKTKAWKIKETETEDDSPECPVCGLEMILRDGKFGKFWGCSNYPKCHGTEQWEDNDEYERWKDDWGRDTGEDDDWGDR